ncbi:TPA: hypothetical protein GRR58_24590, partial [Vibrio parahaemolyticus]|nr:hypothetical protein [Vibrio parahaemolyticus]HAS6511152.1 hypothetical protein [Vibrio parahaemolyticus]HAS6516137.1 hypothetical protein [Vibrio parahaemolyticus]HAS6526172.1 hypothetical protein [Vibrio parahaemolyticus]HAS6540985.1 hypothetical protein [Vibrio parahaemolyticus]
MLLNNFRHDDSRYFKTQIVRYFKIFRES